MSHQCHSRGYFVGIFIFATALIANGLFADSLPQAHPVDAAKAAIKSKQDQEALSLLSVFVRANPGAAEAIEARFLLGQVQSRQRRIDEAFRDFRSVISSARGTEWAAKALEETAKLHEMRRNPTGAQQARDTLLRDYPESSAAVPHLWTKVTLVLDAGDYRNALGLLEKYLANPYARNRSEAERILEAAELALRGDALEAGDLLAERHRERAEMLFSRRLYARAQVDFEHASNLAHCQARRAEMIVRIVLCLTMTGEDRRASTVLNREANRDPELVPLLARHMAEAMGEFPRLETLAEHYLKLSLRRYPAGNETRVALLQFAATQAHILKDPLKAVPHYEEYLRRYAGSPETASAYYQLAAALFYLEDIDAAEVHFQSALNAHPSDPLRAEIEKFLNVVVRAREAKEYLAGLTANDRDYFHAKRFHTQRNFAKASGILQRLSRDVHFRRNPHFREALLLLGDCHLRIGENALAVSTFQEMLRTSEVDELAARAIVGIGSAHLAGRDIVRAGSFAARLPAFEALPVEAYNFLWNLAAMHIAEGHHETAVEFFVLCSKASAPVSIRLPAARILQLLAEPAAVAHSNQSAVEAANDLAIRVGEDLIDAGDLEMAEEIFRRLSQRSIACQPDRAAFLLGVVLLLQEKIEQAGEAFQVVLSQHPQGQFAALSAIRLAIIHTGWLDDPKTGGMLLERAVNDYPGSPHRPQALFFLATLNLWNDKPRLSLELFDQLVVEHPDADEIPYALANIDNLKSQLRIP